MTQKKPDIYRKRNSFRSTYSNLAVDIDQQRDRALAALADVEQAAQDLPANATRVLEEARHDLKAEKAGNASDFRITRFIADEMSLLENDELARYVYHRFRYDIFPKRRIVDDFPPYLQIEPSSVCNYRCVFCYQTDETFSRRKSGHMGTMDVGLWRELVDQAEGRVEFGSIASRGEPLVCRDIDEMLAYLPGKFLGMKLNTNASLLTEAHAHALLNGGLRTVVFSADAAKEPDYSRFRVKGSLERTLKNIRMFQRIRERDYPRLPLITRVSGVMYDPERQDLDEMLKVWGELVDQVAFVAYNPWENVYDADPSGVDAPCSDLWRRMFVWYDGKVNPCDTDYKSHLSPGRVQDSSLEEIWRGPAYEAMRETHIQGRRGGMEPCRRCHVT